MHLNTSVKNEEFSFISSLDCIGIESFASIFLNLSLTTGSWWWCFSYDCFMGEGFVGLSNSLYQWCYCLLWFLWKHYYALRLSPGRKDHRKHFSGAQSLTQDQRDTWRWPPRRKWNGGNTCMDIKECLW